MTTNITFLTVPNLLTCSTVTIEWAYNSTTPPPTSNYSLVVTNIGVNQGGPSRREYPLVPRQSTSVVNMTLGAVNVTTGQFDWIKVNIPQGWYRMNIYASAGPIPSNVFNVTNGLDVSCVVGLPQSSILQSSSLVTSTSISAFTSPSQVASPTSSALITTSTPTVQKGAIVGGVVGGIATLALIAALFLWLSRRRKARVRKVIPPAVRPRTRGQPPKGNHTPSNSTGAILRCGGNRQNSRQLSTSEEDCTSEKSAVADDTMPKLPSIATPRPHSKSSSSPTSDRRPASMVVKPSFESYESASPAHSRYPPDRSRRASRKPVPAYNPNEFPRSEPNNIPPSDTPETILGDGTKIYYIIPDAPLEQRR